MDSTVKFSDLCKSNHTAAISYIVTGVFDVLTLIRVQQTKEQKFNERRAKKEKQMRGQNLERFLTLDVVCRVT